MNDNWKLILEEYQELISKKFINELGIVYIFFGLVHGDDDYYYGLWDWQARNLLLISCVGSLEMMGYVLVEDLDKYQSQ